jgi:hypothetical protein
VIVTLIAATRTTTGLRVRCELDRGVYPKGRDITAAQMAALHLEPHRFHGAWNYTLQSPAWTTIITFVSDNS